MQTWRLLHRRAAPPRSDIGEGKYEADNAASSSSALLMVSGIVSCVSLSNPNNTNDPTRMPTAKYAKKSRIIFAIFAYFAVGAFWRIAREPCDYGRMTFNGPFGSTTWRIASMGTWMICGPAA